LAAGLAVAALAACSGIRTMADRPGIDAATLGTYAWSTDGSRPDAQLAAGNAALDERVRSAVDRELRRLGMRKAEPHEATVLVRQAATVGLTLRPLDPYYSLYTFEEHEEGRLTLDFIDARTGSRVWRGAASGKLRCVTRGVGLLEPHWVGTSEERSWPIEDMVVAVLDPLHRGRSR
jgi:hypothetical protein